MIRTRLTFKNVVIAIVQREEPHYQCLGFHLRTLKM